MREKLLYYQKAVLIDGKLGGTGAGELNRTVNAKMTRMIRQSQVTGIVERPNTHLRALRTANAHAREIYPMGSSGTTQGVRRTTNARR